MHHVKYVKQSPEAIAARKQREKAKIADFLALTDDILTRKKQSDWSKDAFDLTTRLLQVNPEFYTVWNYRRNILVNGLFPKSSPQEINELLANDLSLTMVALKAHPKVYWVWNHRRWCLENIPEGPEVDDPLGWRKAYWDKEMIVVERMLDVDPRNFMAWNYRRYVLASMPVPRSELAELAYTLKKIESELSNFSAWHQRSKVLTALWSDGRLDPVESREAEFDILHNAMFTDPNDQSVWLYHRWLIGSGDDKERLEGEIAVIQELLDEKRQSGDQESDNKWCMESIVYYKTMLIAKHSSSVDVVGLRTSCEDFLKQLMKLDPARRNRYQDKLTQLVSGHGVL
ncbi:protein prenylyltransferase [Hymenopellis radicata]|nr:protein prenylyltransferase [Hymenopellis radicata]